MEQEGQQDTVHDHHHHHHGLVDSSVGIEVVHQSQHSLHSLQASGQEGLSTNDGSLNDGTSAHGLPLPPSLVSLPHAVLGSSFFTNPGHDQGSLSLHGSSNAAQQMTNANTQPQTGLFTFALFES